jgi:hypothetical protein
LPGPLLPALVFTGKLLLAVACLAIAVRAMRKDTFVAAGERGAIPLEMAPSLLVLMVMASPLVWEHHAIFLGLPYLLVAAHLKSSRGWGWFAFAYTLEFLMPTFDFFPWSYGRLVSPIILLALMRSLPEHAPVRRFLDLDLFEPHAGA